MPPRARRLKTWRASRVVRAAAAHVADQGDHRPRGADRGQQQDERRHRGLRVPGEVAEEDEGGRDGRDDQRGRASGWRAAGSRPGRGPWSRASARRCRPSPPWPPASSGTRYQTGAAATSGPGVVEAPRGRRAPCTCRRAAGPAGPASRPSQVARSTRRGAVPARGDVAGVVAEQGDEGDRAAEAGGHRGEQPGRPEGAEQVRGVRRRGRGEVRGVGDDAEQQQGGHADGEDLAQARAAAGSRRRRRRRCTRRAARTPRRARRRSSAAR